MTLIRNPCSDFDTMSLFQDLKLKRRKIDSRCSSDGESIADTSTSSPDLAAPISPTPCKMVLDHMRISPSPGACSLTPDNRVSSPENGILDNHTSESMETDEIPVVNGCGGPLKIKEEPNVFDGGGVKSTENGCEDRASDLKESTEKVLVNHNGMNNCGVNKVIVNNNCSNDRPASNGNNNHYNVIKNAIRVRCASDIIGSLEEQHQQQQQRRESVVVSSAVAMASWNSEHNMDSGSESRGSPAAVNNKSDSSSSSSSSSSSMSSMEIPGSGSMIGVEMPITTATPNSLYCSVIASPPRLWMTTPATTAPNMLNSCRINGVRPELIGGVNYCETMKPPVTVPQKPTNSSSSGIRNTPTVIMGEAGGVRTMIWSTPVVENHQPPVSSPSSPHHQQMSPPSHQQQLSPLQHHHQMQQQSQTQNIAQSPSRSPSWIQTSISSSLPMNPASKSSPTHIFINTNHDSSNSNHIVRTTMPSSVISNISQQQQQQQQQHNQHRSMHSLPVPLNMERLWAGDLTQLPASQQIQALNLTSPPTIPSWQNFLKANGEIPNSVVKLLPTHNNSNNNPEEPIEEDEQPMICMICEDKATGLHYGIITCEGCKGFFKRTVQNRRVYTCVADGVCEITKAQRNRCQYCRFKKCLEQGMVLQAVREDRMPGGRNSGAVYNLYKVKYKKHKKTTRVNGQLKPDKHNMVNHNQDQQQLHQQQQQMMQHHQQQQHQSPQRQSSHQQHNSYLQNQQQQHHQQQQEQHQMHNSQQQEQQQKFSVSEHSVASHPRSPHLINGTILKTALTNPSEVVYLRQRLDNTVVTSSRDRTLSIDTSFNMIQTLVDCDEFQDIATLQNLEDLLEHKSDLSDKLMQIGDSIVYKLVQWTKRLPFYLELPVEVHTRLLTHRWHELLVLTTSAYQAIHGSSVHRVNGHSEEESVDDNFNESVSNNLRTLQSCLTSMMGKTITIDQLRQDVGLMVEKITHVTLMFKQIRLRMEEYVCLKVIIMLNPARASCSELEIIQERYMACLKMYIEQTSPQQPNRFHDLLVRLPEVQSAASLLLESKMFYVPFLLNSTIHR